MANILEQLYKTKLLLAATIATASGIAIMTLGQWMTTASAPHWLNALPIPVTEIGSGIFGFGIIGIGIEYFTRKVSDELASKRTAEILRQQTPAFVSALLDAFALTPNKLQGIASNELLDQIVVNALGIRLGDAQLARDAYTDLHEQVIHASEFWHNLDVSVTLSPWTGGPAAGHGSMFVATIRWEYRVHTSAKSMRFACVSQMDEYRELLRDPTVNGLGYFGSSSGIDAGSQDAFTVVNFAVNGRDRPIRRTERRGSQLYTVNIGTDDNNEPITISYTYRMLLQRNGHLLYLDLPRPTKGLHIQLNHANTGIRRVNTLDFFASSKQARIDQTSDISPAKTIDIGFDEWVFPRSGVAFVWVLEEEFREPPKQLRSVPHNKPARNDGKIAKRLDI